MSGYVEGSAYWWDYGPRGAAGGGRGWLVAEPLHDSHPDVEDVACEPFGHGNL